jgi:hypothetical protein
VLVVVLTVGLVVGIVGVSGCASSKPVDNSQNAGTTTGGTGATTGSTGATTGGTGGTSSGAGQSSGTNTSGAKTRYEQDNPDIAYQGTWATLDNAIHSAGSYAYTKTVGSSVTIKFHGTAISYITAKDDIFGVAKVTLDGGTPATVDLYKSGDPVGQQKVWSASGLADSDHTLVIECTGAKNPASGAKYIGLDAVDVVGTLIDAH